MTVLGTSSRTRARTDLARQLRVDAVRCTAAAGSGHPTSSMSAADLMAVLLDGYLTMDLWWSRTFNRLRGDLLPQATVTGLANIKQLLGNPEMTDEQAIELAKPYRDAYAKRGFKGDSKLEKAANTLLKAAEDEINEAPNNASDREFMVSSAQRARQILAADVLEETGDTNEGPGRPARLYRFSAQAIEMEQARRRFP